MIVGITWWGYSSIHARRSITNTKRCKTCKHCEEYEALDLEYLCPEPAFKCKAKDQDIVFLNAPKPFCERFELSIPKDEMLDEERNIQRLAKAFADMGCNANKATEALKKLQMTVTQENINTYLIEQVGGSSTSTSIRKPKSTNCPNCGAPVDIHAEKCAYCDTPYI
jgi:hypothetical protein